MFFLTLLAPRTGFDGNLHLANPLVYVIDTTISESMMKQGW
jgi:hypothetical protein